MKKNINAYNIVQKLAEDFDDDSIRCVLDILSLSHNTSN